METFGYLILAIMFVVEVFEMGIEILNLKHSKRVKENPPQEVLRVVKEDNLKKAISYLFAKTKARLLGKAVHIPVFFGLFLSGALVWYSNYVNDLTQSEILRGVIFLYSFAVFFMIVGLPTNIYKTFVVERNFGFNRYTPVLYLIDKLKMLVITFIMMAISLSAVITIIRFAGPLWWLYAAILGSLVMLVVAFIWPGFLSAVFNKYERLEEGSLRDKINSLAGKAKFAVDNILRMDASKRSAHTNASFSGVGKKRRIVLYDTLLENSTDQEIIAVLAHEIGHYKLKHIQKKLLWGILLMFGCFFVMGLLINRDFIYNWFGFEKSIYLGIFLISVLFSPVKAVFTPIGSLFSRKQEYEADRYALELLDDKQDMIKALLSLNRSNLSNPYPHPFYSRWYYSHPTLLERVGALERVM
jgi:STE24 endopeptidase